MSAVGAALSSLHGVARIPCLLLGVAYRFWPLWCDEMKCANGSIFRAPDELFKAIYWPWQLYEDAGPRMLLETDAFDLYDDAGFPVVEEGFVHSGQNYIMEKATPSDHIMNCPGIGSEILSLRHDLCSLFGVRGFVAYRRIRGCLVTGVHCTQGKAALFSYTKLIL